MITQKKLAICIPTYNRPNYLLKLLETICMQLNAKNKDKIQICISDNNSEEDYSIIIDYMERHSVEFIYKKSEQNYGADANFLKAIDIANAEYCWLAGDDDGIAPNAIDTVLDYIERNPHISVFWGNRIICNKTLTPFLKERWTKEKTNFVVDFQNDEQIINYFNMLNSTTSLGYLTSLIIKKDEWNSELTNCKKYMGTVYIHVAQYLSMLYGKGKMLCIHDYIALSRFGNDGFYKNLKQRIFLDYYGFLAITDIFKSSPKIVESIKGIVKRHYNCIFLCAMAYTCTLDEKELEILKRIGYSKKELKIFSKCKPLILYYLGVSILKYSFTDFKWFIKTCFITLQKIK
jgi:abequosyltransferase